MTILCDFLLDTRKLQFFTLAKVNMQESRMLGELIDPLFFLALTSESLFCDLAYDSNISQFLNISLQAFLDVHQLLRLFVPQPSLLLIPY